MDALRAFGRVLLSIHTDPGSIASHQLKRGEAARGFNTEYLALCAHLRPKPRTIKRTVRRKNGYIERALAT
jgi:hypothetical protein